MKFAQDEGVLCLDLEVTQVMTLNRQLEKHLDFNKDV
jgi:hypothetical protein